MKCHNEHRIIISGGGTGGHIFPAISIANAIRIQDPGAGILFVGALGRMEMEKVPEAGYEIVGLPIAGLQRDMSWKGIKANLMLPLQLIRSIREARKIIREFRPTVAVGVGGYASGPLLWVARKKASLTYFRNKTVMPEKRIRYWLQGHHASVWLIRVWKSSFLLQRLF